MIDFNTLLWSPYNRTLTIDVSVSTLGYFTNVYIDRVVIDTQDTFVSTGPSSNPIYSYQFDSAINSKSFQRVLTSADLLTVKDNNIYFVYIIIKGTPASDTPCGMDNATSMETTMDMVSLYRAGLDYLEQLNNTDVIPSEFIDFLLRVKAFQLCIDNKNYILALLYWNRFFSNNTSTYTNCTCHG